MPLNLFLAQAMAKIPITVMPIAKAIRAMLTIQSETSEIERTARIHEQLFAVYVAVLVGGFLLATLFTVLVWRSNTKHQDAVKADADARIAEATLRIRELENENLRLQRDIMLLRLQATDPNRSQAEFDHHMAELERQMGQLVAGGPAIPSDRSLFDRNVGPRTERRKLSDESKRKIVEALASKPKETIEIVSAADPVLQGEPHEYGAELAEAFKSAGWTVIDLGESPVISPLLPTLTLYVSSKDQYTQHSALYTAFWALGLLLQVTVEPSDSRREQPPLLIVGLLG